jgi:hypothetical protein
MASVQRAAFVGEGLPAALGAHRRSSACRDGQLQRLKVRQMTLPNADARASDRTADAKNNGRSKTVETEKVAGGRPDPGGADDRRGNE